MITNNAMDESFQAILDSLPPKPPRSKLEPYAELIQELRRRGWSYREIAGILAERCGVTAGTHTVYNFVRVRAPAQKRTKNSVRAGSGRTTQSSIAAAPDKAGATPQEEGTDQVWQRIEALKQRPTPRAGAAKKEFHYDENEPLRLISDPKAKEGSHL